MKNISSFEQVFPASNFFFFSSYPTKFGIFKLEKHDENIDEKGRRKSRITSNYRVQKSFELLPIQSDVTGNVSYVPLPVRTIKNSTSVNCTPRSEGGLGGTIGGYSDRGPSRFGGNSGNRIENGVGWVGGVNGVEDGEEGDLWISSVRVINNKNSKQKIISSRVCVCLRVKEIEKEIIIIEDNKNIKNKKNGAPPGGKNDKDENSLGEGMRTNKFSCHIFILDADFWNENCKITGNIDKYF